VGVGEAGTNRRVPAVQKGARDPIMLHMVCVSGLCYCLPFVRINPFSPVQVTLRWRISLFDILQRMLAGSPLWGGGGGPKVSPGSQPTPGGPASAMSPCCDCALYCIAAYRTAICSERGTKLN
jgi:hypothetical protein